jgi:hypothetical protein
MFTIVEPKKRMTMKILLQQYTRFILTMALLLPGLVRAQEVQRSQTTSQGGGLSTQSTIRNFGVAGQQVFGTATGGGNTLNAGFIYSVSNYCPRPYNLTVTVAHVGENDNTASLTWAMSGLQNNAEIRYKIEGTIPWTTVTATGTSYQLTGLLDGVNYIVQVRTVCGATFFSGYSQQLSFATPGPPACNVPGPISTTSISESEQQLTWPSTGAGSYDVRYRLKGNLTWTFVNGLTEPTTSLTGLSAGMTYQVQARSVCNTIQTTYSDLAEFTTTGASVCETPGGLTASTTLTSAMLTWSHPGAPSYQVRYRLKNATIWTAVNTTEKTITLSDLDPGMIYVFTVRATCNATTGLSSTNAEVIEFAMPGPPVCDVPGNFLISPGTDAAFINWNAGTGALLYELRYRVEGTSVWNTIKTTSDTLRLGGLSAGTSYQVQARSVCNTEGTLTSAYTSTLSFSTTGITACNTPSALQANAATNSAALTWTQQTGAFGYEVRYKLEGSTTWSYETTTSNSITISSLQSGMPYLWAVRTICDQNKTLASPYAAIAGFETVGVVACKVPTAITVNNITDQAATVSWGSVDASSYQIRYRLSGTTIWTLTSSSTPTVTLSGLESGMPYQVQVKAICTPDGSLQSLFGDLVTFETIGQVSCEVPFDLSAKNITTSSATIGWVVASGAYEYQVRYRVKGTTLWTTVTSATNEHNLSGLEPGMTYQFSVRSNCSSNPQITSVYSLPSEFTTTGLPSCEIPAGLSVNAGETDAEITWTSTGALSYEVRYRVSGSTAWINLVAASNTINLASLYSKTEYQFQVRSVCLADGSLKSVFSQVEFFSTTGTVSCETPTNLAVSSITNTGAVVQWSASAGVYQYDVRYRVKGTTFWKQVLTNVPSVTLSGLSTGMPYQIRVRTICTADQSLVSAYSTIEEFTTTGESACQVPSGLQTLSVDVSSATITWLAATGSIGYEILYRKVGELIWSSLVSSGNTVSITGLSSGTKYDWKVRTQCAIDKSLMSQYSEVSSFTTIIQTNSSGSGRYGQDVSAAPIPDKESTGMNLDIYPNPFSEQVNIRVTPSHTSVYELAIYNMTGQKVERVFEGELKAGNQTAFSWVAHDQPSGIYVFKMVSKDGKEIIRKMILAH